MTEIKPTALATSGSSIGDAGPLQKNDNSLKENQHTEDEALISLAIRELERRTIRANILPSTLFSDIGWLILLDLLVNEQSGNLTALPDHAPRWGVSQETVRRQVEGLIAYGLVERRDAIEAGLLGPIGITVDGREALRSALKLSQ